MLELAHHIVEMKSGHFTPQKFEDQYENALKKLLNKKQAGQPVELPERREPARVINLMEALRQSVEASRATGKPPAPSTKVRQAKAEGSKKPKSRRAS
jgi:DNA end-binding protein Ku